MHRNRLQKNSTHKNTVVTYKIIKDCEQAEITKEWPINNTIHNDKRSSEDSKVPLPKPKLAWELWLIKKLVLASEIKAVTNQ